jgi:hypothetical protein
MVLRDDDGMADVEGGDVEEGEDEIVFIDFAAGDFAADDFAEYAFFHKWHGFTSMDWL